MKIIQILSQHRRDFTAMFECEHCGHQAKQGGYDDDYFHSEVIPNMECPKCRKISPDEFEPLTPKYAEGVQV